MERLIVQKGGSIANSVGYNTDYLVIPDELRRDITTKITKANRFGVEIKRRSQFLLLINS
jgi:NAD-dependent DNA ligase